MTDNKRICITMSPELEQKIVDLRKTDEFCRKSISEIVRMLIEKGLTDDSETA